MEKMSLELRKETRYIINFLIYSNIVIILFFAHLQDPFTNSLSMIGNRYEFVNLLYFITWSIYFSGSTYYIVMKLFRYCHYQNDLSILLLRLSCVILVVMTLIPARLEMPILRGIHIGFAIIQTVVFAFAFHPFVSEIVNAREKRSIHIHVWMVLVWPGSIALLFLVGWNAIYQLSYLINLLLFLLYICRIVFKFHINTIEKRE